MIRGVDERLAEIELMMATLNEQRNLVDDPADLIESGVAGLCQAKGVKQADASPARPAKLSGV